MEPSCDVLPMCIIRSNDDYHNDPCWKISRDIQHISSAAKVVILIMKGRRTLSTPLLMPPLLTIINVLSDFGLSVGFCSCHY